MKVLKLGSVGAFVSQWQTFLRGQGFLVDIDGAFGKKTNEATESFQRRHKLAIDGVVGNETLGKAALLGFELVSYFETESVYPALPSFEPLLSTKDRQDKFGKFDFTPAPTADNPERIKILGGWDTKNIQRINIPQLKGVKGANQNGDIHCHRLVAKQFQQLWQAWEDRGLLSLVLTYSGDYVPRFIRGKAAEQALSNHAFGTAFDINYAWNKLGAQPATDGEQGCVYKLVPVAHEFGFYWGGHFTRRDGMHFEVAVLHGEA